MNVLLSTSLEKEKQNEKIKKLYHSSYLSIHVHKCIITSVKMMLTYVKWESIWHTGPSTCILRGKNSGQVNGNLDIMKLTQS